MRWPRIDPPLRPVVAAGATLGLAVGVFGLSFGVGAVSAGASVAQACALSLLVFTGASQFSVVSVIGAGGSAAAALGGALLLAARNGVYGLALSRHLEGSLGRRLVAAQLVIDETTAMTVVQADSRAQRTAFWATGLSVYLCWNVGTLLGAVAGETIDPETFGLDVAFPAAFVAMVWPMLRTRRGALAGAAGAVICLALIPVTPIGVPILCAAAGVLVGLPAPADPAGRPGPEMRPAPAARPGSAAAPSPAEEPGVGER